MSRRTTFEHASSILREQKRKTDLLLTSKKMMERTAADKFGHCWWLLEPLVGEMQNVRLAVGKPGFDSLVSRTKIT